MTELTIYAAGSLRHAFNALLPLARRATGCAVKVEFGPAGLLRRRIELGERPALFASANLDHPRYLQNVGLVREVYPFATNRLCVTVRNTPELTEPPLLEVLCDPRWRVATSTPGDDPGGDYALQLFDRVEQQRPGKGAALAQRARALVGGARCQPLPPGRMAAEYLLNEGLADLFPGYASHAAALSAFTNLAVRMLPPALTVTARYGCGLLSGHPDARALLQVILSAEGQTCLRAHGFGGL
ncbi:molybdenum ABC transporter substrate-binding protein [Jejubacter calystegiae]|uniref:Molybdenum ABC transporter substrate-binding protein n=1 Tax=Jejubacter calystegiae TaxID=2579935 RepID=A0A4P8YM01_9ENTR|nr:substrate-binding domain-containing protein [Jejubacter calystegiae]QCT21865.1 molybdenum ABC transporter substrate-binding protein [Jejubacter calystegiae]